ncbi:hypothetical protein [Paraburkholderia caribensis]|uniref:hypothetical protein n=1 Tax=Paraburkholderia caribensis TaxID=75105 RepID=UPI000A55F646
MKRLGKASSSQERGRHNAERLMKWAKETAPNAIPLNQFRRVSRSRVCEQLAIPLSTIRTNSVLKGLFEGLDAKVLLYYPQAATNSKASLASPDEIERLRLEKARLDIKLRALEHRVHVLQYLENFGIVVI